MPPRARDCEICSVTYKPTYNKQRTCGRDCGWKLKVREGRTNAIPRATRQLEATCIQCGETFIYEARTASARRLFCQQACIDAHEEANTAAYLAAQAEARKRQCPGCKTQFTQTHGSQVYCSKRCGRRKSGHRDRHKNHRKRARHHGVRYEPVNPEYIFERDGWRCGICTKRIDRTLVYPEPMSASLDHVLPMACGGEHVASNLRAAHWLCNALKSDGTTTHGEQLMLIG